MLQTQSLGKAFGELVVLEDVSLSFVPGERLGILGPSGCGKTTLLRMLLGLEQPTSGQLTGQLDRAGYLPQGNLLLPWKTVVENVELPLRLKGVRRDVYRARALQLLDAVALRSFEGSYPFELSGGMQQRVALLRAVIAGAPTLVLDEPFGSLDTMTRHSLQDWLLDLIEEWELSMLFVTHDLEEAVVLGQRVLVLRARPGTVAHTFPVDLANAARRDRHCEAFLAAREGLYRLIAGKAHV